MHYMYFKASIFFFHLFAIYIFIWCWNEIFIQSIPNSKRSSLNQFRFIIYVFTAKSISSETEREREFVQILTQSQHWILNIEYVLFAIFSEFFVMLFVNGSRTSKSSCLAHGWIYLYVEYVLVHRIDNAICMMYDQFNVTFDCVCSRCIYRHVKQIEMIL